MKKLLSLILSMLMVFSLIPAFAISAEEAETPEAEYAEDTVAVIGSTEYKTLFGEDGALSNTESVLAGAAKDVVTLVKDVKETGSATLKSDAVLDLAGYDIINYGTATVIDTNGYKLHIRNTAYQETNERAKFGYSGTLLSTKANVTMEDVYFYERNVFPEYKAEVNMLDGVSWCAGMYWRDSKHKDLTNYDYQMGYTASGTKISDGVYEKQFIEVEYGKSYYTYCSTTLTDSFAVTLIGFDENDTPLVNYGKTNVVTITDESVVKVGVNVYCTNEWKDTYKYGKLATCISKGEVTPYMHEITDLCKTVASANAFVNFTNSTPITWTMDNCVYNQTSGTASILNLTKPIKFDFWDSTFSFANFGGKNSFTINNASSSGGIYNCTFSGNNAQGVVINNTSSEGLGLIIQNCTITTSGDGRTALTISGGKVTLADGTMGSTGSSNNTNISGGDVTVTGTKFNGSKSNGYVLNISTSAVVSILKATIVKGGTTIKDTTTFLNSLPEGIALYKATTLTVENILLRTAALNTLSAFYVDVCQHFCTATQNGSKVCAYCESEVTSIYHDYSSIKYDATHHWGVCARCDEVQAKTQHTVGTAGTAATCTEAAVCGTCNQKFGEPLGHSFTDYQLVSTAIAGCEHNPVTKAVCDNNCGEEDYDYSALVNLKVTKEAVAPTCTEVGYTVERSCTECNKVIEPATEIPATGHNFEGGLVVTTEPNYAHDGKGTQTCQVDGCGYSEEVVIPKKEFNGSTLAITGDYDNPVQHKTIQDAVDAVEDGGTIILVKDGTFEGNITTNKEVIFDLAGHNLTTSTASYSFETTKNFELRSTDLGLGKLYSGVYDIPASSSTDKYGTITDVPNTELYVAGHYSQSTGKLEANTNRIAHKKLIAVDNTRSYIFKTGCADANVQFVVREYNKKGVFTKSIGPITNGSTYTPTANAAYYISVAIWETGDTTSDLMGMLKAGEINPTLELSPIKGTVAYSKPFIKTSAQFKMSNVKVSTSANVSFFESTAADVATPAKFVAKDCLFTTGGSAAPLKFTTNATEIDIQDSSIYSTTGNGFEIASNGVFGTIKNTKISRNSGLALTISKSAAKGIVIDGCSIYQGAYDTTVAQISGGKVTLTGNTKISGSSKATTVLNASGGTIILDGVTIDGDKGNTSNGKLLAWGANATIEVKKATFQKGTNNSRRDGQFTNNWTKFWESAKRNESAVYKTSDITSTEYAYEYGTTINPTYNSKDPSTYTIYVGSCVHDIITTTCTDDGSCVHCGKEYAAYGHDYSGFDSDEQFHWAACVRCKAVEDENNVQKVAHSGGAATCTEGAACEVCNTIYTEANGHTFTDKIGHDDAEHWITCDVCEDAKKPGSSGAHVSTGDNVAGCETPAVCDSCKQSYGQPKGHNMSAYIYNGDATCTKNGTKTAVCLNGCGTKNTLTAENTIVDHKWITEPGTPATCKKTGLSEWTYCENCGNVREEQEVLPIEKNGHLWDAGKITTTGNCSTDCILTYTCTVCKTTATYNFGKVANIHSYSSTFTIDTPATYFATGIKSRHCTKCGAKTAVTVIPKLKLAKVTVRKAYKATTNSVTIKYKKVTGATSYVIQVKLNGKWKKVGTTNKAKFTIKKLKSGTSYQVRVRAIAKSGTATAKGKNSKAKTVKCK